LIYSGHSDNVFALAWAPDGATIASGGRDTTVQIWNPHPGGRGTSGPYQDFGGEDGPPEGGPYIYRGHAACLLSLAWSPDGQAIASGCTAGLVQVWHPNNGATFTTYRGHQRFVRSIVWSPDSQFIASGGDFGDSTLQIWEARNGQLRSLHEDQYRLFSLSWSPDGTRLASASFDGSVFVRAADSGTPQLPYREHNGPVYAVSWSPDSTRLASAGQDSTVHIWSPVDGRTIMIYRGHHLPVKTLSWSPDGTMLASAGDDASIQIWEPSGGASMAAVEPQRSWVRALAWSPDGRSLASASGKIVRIDQIARLL